MLHIKSGDKVKVLSGKDKGKTGKVLQVFPKENRASVEGINLLIKHMRQTKQNEKGQKIQFPAPLNLSKVMLVCPKCHKPTRAKRMILENKKKVRVCRKCQEAI